MPLSVKTYHQMYDVSTYSNGILDTGAQSYAITQAPFDTNGDVVPCRESLRLLPDVAGRSWMFCYHILSSSVAWTSNTPKQRQTTNMIKSHFVNRVVEILEVEERKNISLVPQDLICGTRRRRHCLSRIYFVVQEFFEERHAWARPNWICLVTCTKEVDMCFRKLYWCLVP